MVTPRYGEGMISSRVPLVSAAVVAGILLVQSIIIAVFGYSTLLPQLAVQAGANELRSVLPGVFGSFFVTVVNIVVFGIGVFVSLRFVAPIRSTDGWLTAILRGVVATAIGAVALLVLGIIETLFATVTAGLYPFGYAFHPGIGVDAAGRDALDSVQAGVTALVEWSPLVILAGLVQKIWLQHHPTDS